MGRNLNPFLDTGNAREPLPSQLFLNPYLPESTRKCWQKTFQQICPEPGFWGIATSGTTQLLSKIVVLSQTALLTSAQAVNQHLQVTSADIWLHCLPDFHVGGLGIWVRSALSQSRVVKPLDFKWSAQRCLQELKCSGATLMSLVPTQVYDLVKDQCQAPVELRAVIVGGGSLSPHLYQQARELGWPLLPSYGLTECSSQVATASLASLENNSFPLYLPVLSHMEVKLSSHQELMIRSSSLLTQYILMDEKGNGVKQWDPKVEGWFTTEDRAYGRENEIQLLGRKDDQVKILGELVNLSYLEDRLLQKANELRMEPAVTIFPIKNSRQGAELILVYETSRFYSQEAKELLDLFNEDLLPFQRIKRSVGLPQLPRSPMGKILRLQLQNHLELEFK